MKKHLEHYGYFTGRNMTIARFGYEPKHSSMNNESDESDTESDDSEISVNNNNQHKTKCFAHLFIYSFFNIFLIMELIKFIIFAKS